MEKVAALQSLVYLYEQKEATRTDLRNNIDAALKTIYSALPVLVQSQLIEEKISNKFPFTVTIHLTEKGRKVAWHLAEIVKILKE